MAFKYAAPALGSQAQNPVAKGSMMFQIECDFDRQGLHSFVVSGERVSLIRHDVPFCGLLQPDIWQIRRDVN